MMVDGMIYPICKCAIILALFYHDALEGSDVLVVAKQTHGPTFTLFGEANAADVVLVFTTKCVHLNSVHGCLY